MKQVLITSTILIIVILLLRLILRKWVSKRLIYATWLLVALRLLIPVQFGQSDHSIVAVTERLAQDPGPVQQIEQVFQEPVSGPSREELYQQLMQDYLAQTKEPATTPQPDVTTPSVQQPTVTPEIQAQIQQEVEAQIAAPTLGQILRTIWIGGAVLMAGWFLITNLLFLSRARKDAIPCADVTAPVRIRISPNVSTPCLAGLIRPTIYLTPASAADPQIRDHVLTHELTHLRHLDHIWAWLRCVCLCVYWFDPLVWVAAIVSKRDCELACDEAALKKLGDSQRIAYGKALLATVTHSPVHVLQTATAMSETKKQLKERVNFIVKKPKNLLIAAICLILAVALTAGLVFTGCRSDSGPTTPSTSQGSTSPEQPDPGSDVPDTPTEETMLQLLKQATEIVENNHTITLDAHGAIKAYLDSRNLLPEILEINDDTITLKTRVTDHWTDAFVYAVFLDLVLDRYADDITTKGFIFSPSSGIGSYYAPLFLYTGWKEAGYDSVKDCYSAIDAGELEMPQEAFYISLSYHSITPARNSSKNIYELFFAPDSPQIDTSASAWDDFSCTKDSVDDFMAILTAAQAEGLIAGVNFDEGACYNVTPAAVAEATDIQIFKFSDSCASFALIAGEVYEICPSFGGCGFVNAVPWDHDNDGNLDLLVASSWGSGIHYAEITVFNTATKKSTSVYSSNSSDLIVQEIRSPNSTKLYAVLTAKIECDQHLANLSCQTSSIVGFIRMENGALTFIDPMEQQHQIIQELDDLQCHIDHLGKESTLYGDEAVALFEALNDEMMAGEEHTGLSKGHYIALWFYDGPGDYLSINENTYYGIYWVYDDGTMLHSVHPAVSTISSYQVDASLYRTLVEMITSP